MVTPTSNPLGYLGIDSLNPRDTFYRRRNPTVTDLRPYKLGDRWINTQAASAFILVSKSNSIADWEAMGGGSTQVASLSGNTGGAIFPVAGNINLFGTSGLIFDGVGNTLTVNNLRDLSPFVVSPFIGESEYTSIQAAMNAALLAGGGNVIILPGTYSENLTFISGVNLIGLQDPRSNSGALTHIIGNHVFPATNFFSVQNLSFNAAAGNTFATTAGANVSVIFDNCVLNQLAGPGSVFNIDAAAGGTNFYFYQCNFAAVDRVFNLIANAQVQLNGCTTIAPSTFVCSSNGSQFSFASDISGEDFYSDTSTGTYRFCRLNNSVQNLQINLGAAVELTHCSVNSPFAFYATGTGALNKALNVCTGAATTPEGTLTVTTFTTS